MASIIQYEAPPGATSFQPKMEGISAINEASNQTRRVAAREAEIGHQMGQQIDRGLTELGSGVSSMEAAGKKANKQAELLAAAQAESAVNVSNELKAQQMYKDADPLDTTVAEKVRQMKQDARNGVLAGIKDPEVRLHIGERNASADVADVHQMVQVQSERAVNAVNLTLQKTLNDRMDQITLNPHDAFRLIADEPAQLNALVKSMPGLDAQAGQDIVTKHTLQRQGIMAAHAIEAYAKQDPDGTAKQLEPGGALHDLKQYLTPEQLKLAEKQPYIQKEENFKQETADAKIAQAKLEERGRVYQNTVDRKIMQAGLAGKEPPWDEIRRDARARGADTSEAGVDPRIATSIVNMADRATAKDTGWTEDNQVAGDTIRAAARGQLTEDQINDRVFVEHGINLATRNAALASIPNKHELKTYDKDLLEHTLEGFKHGILQTSDPMDKFGKGPINDQAWAVFEQDYRKMIIQATTPKGEQGGGGMTMEQATDFRGPLMKRIRAMAKEATEHPENYIDHGTDPVAGSPNTVPETGKAKVKSSPEAAHNIMFGGGGRQ